MVHSRIPFILRLCIFLSVFLFSFGNTAMSQLIVAHRGASYDAPENTLAAFRLAWEQGADGIEGDFFVTKDQQIVCIHDADTKRTGGTKLVVADSTLAELRRLEYGAWKDPKFRGEPIPTFAEVMESIPAGKRFVIELKTGPEIVPLLKAEIERLRPQRELLLIIAFKQSTVAACKELLPDVKAHWLTGYKQDKQTHAWKPNLLEVVEGLRISRADGLGTEGNRGIVTKDFLSDLTKQGLKEFHVWTIDDPADARFFQSLGAYGITTNRPAFIRQAIQASP
jgi:glycerophosphoryl diester phosphodiesterase